MGEANRRRKQITRDKRPAAHCRTPKHATTAGCCLSPPPGAPPNPKQATTAGCQPLDPRHPFQQSETQKLQNKTHTYGHSCFAGKGMDVHGARSYHLRHRSGNPAPPKTSSCAPFPKVLYYMIGYHRQAQALKARLRVHQRMRLLDLSPTNAAKPSAPMKRWRLGGGTKADPWPISRSSRN